MTFDLEFADSEVASVQCHGETLVIRFSAAHVRRLGESGIETGYARTLQASFTAAHWSGELQDCVGRIAEARLSIDGRAVASIGLPFDHAGALSAEFAFNNRAELSIAAGGVQIGFAGDPDFNESFAC